MAVGGDCIRESRVVVTDGSSNSRISCKMSSDNIGGVVVVVDKSSRNRKVKVVVAELQNSYSNTTGSMSWEYK